MDTSTTSTICWFHAVNTREKLQRATAAIRENVASPIQLIGIELDIRVNENELVTQHSPGDEVDLTLADALIAGPQCLLAALIAQRQSTGGESPGSTIIKLDVKEPVAICGVLKQLEGLGDALQPEALWLNADVLRGGTSAAPRVEFDVSTDSQLLRDLAANAARKGLTLSLGWTTSSDSKGVYTPAACAAMAHVISLIVDYPAAARTPFDVTFPVRYSCVRNDEAAVVALQRLLLDTVSLIEQGCDVLRTPRRPRAFLTFWRARDESIGDADVTWAENTFPGCTIDRD